MSLLDLLPWVLAAVAFAVAGLQFGIWWRMRRAVGHAVEGVAPGRRLYYFHSPTCGPCRTMTPVVERLREGRDDVELVDVSVDPDAARRFGALATPAFVLVEDGRVARVLVGPQPEARLRALLDGRG